MIYRSVKYQYYRKQTQFKAVCSQYFKLLFYTFINHPFLFFSLEAGENKFRDCVDTNSTEEILFLPNCKAVQRGATLYSVSLNIPLCGIINCSRVAVLLRQVRQALLARPRQRNGVSVESAYAENKTVPFSPFVINFRDA